MQDSLKFRIDTADDLSTVSRWRGRHGSWSSSSYWRDSSRQPLQQRRRRLLVADGPSRLFLAPCTPPLMIKRPLLQGSCTSIYR